MRDELDRFYTPDDTADHCVGMMNLDDYDLIVEPSAGQGSFSTKIPRCVSYDISPADESITQADFLQLTSNDIREHNSLLIIGNPPFGKRSATAKSFIRHSINLGADTIAFILPNTFSKHSNQTMFPQQWRLVEHSPLPDDHFLLDGNKIHIPCSFFVWTQRDDYLPGVDLRDAKQPPAAEFMFLPRGDAAADFCVNGNSGRVRDVCEVSNTKAEHYIKVRDGFNLDDVRGELNSMVFPMVSSVNGGVAWISRNDILKQWHSR